MKNSPIIINDYTLIVDNYNPIKNITKKTQVNKEVLGFVFYGSGKSLVQVDNKHEFHKKTGNISSFYTNEKTEFTHNISHKKQLQKATIFLTPEKVNSFIEQEKILYKNHFKQLLKPKNNYVEGSNFLITPEIQNALNKILHSNYTGVTQKLFLESQIIELLSHYFGLINETPVNKLNINTKDIDKLYHAKELLLNSIDTPPSLNDLSILTGLNNYKLKKGFKEIFGLPVYKYLHNKRMIKAFELLENKDLSVQEVAWYVGYESLGSFSNAFYKKYGFRPSEINK